MTTTAETALAFAFAEGTRRALTKRADALRKAASSETTTLIHGGRAVRIYDPKAVVALDTAILFEECAAEVLAMVGASAEGSSHG